MSLILLHFSSGRKSPLLTMVFLGLNDKNIRELNQSVSDSSFNKVRHSCPLTRVRFTNIFLMLVYILVEGTCRDFQRIVNEMRYARM